MEGTIAGVFRVSNTMIKRHNVFSFVTRSNYLSRFISSEVGNSSAKALSRCRTLEDDPVNHEIQHENKFYAISPSVCSQLFKYGGIPKPYQIQAKAFGETCLMVRQPALEIINSLKEADYSRPVLRYVLFGEPGSGKSLCMAHILHYALNSGHLIVHIPWVPDWMKKPKDHCRSETKEGFRDTPIDSAKWLMHFKNQNQHILLKPDITVTNKYVWSRREETLPGAPLLELVDLGINRIKYASSIIVALAAEIKILSTNNRCRTLVVIDGFNSFFNERTEMKDESWKRVPPSQLTVTEAFMELTKFDWCNGSVLVTVDRLVWREGMRNENDFPFYQLGKEAFEHLEPFVPIQVHGYSEKEFHSCVDYYIDRNWIQNERGSSEEARTELMYLCAGNPYQLMKICGPL